MDAFKRATLLSCQAALGQITSDEIRTEMQTLIPAMQADPESHATEADAGAKKNGTEETSKNW